MFTGIIEQIGKIVAVHPSEGGARMIVGVKDATRLHTGDSVAVDGVCLTVVKKQGRKMYFDVSAETWNRTNFAVRKQDDAVNIELPMTATTMLSGHFVQGHVDGIGRVKGWTRSGADVQLFVTLPAELIQYCVPKGSIALNGVSLTIASQKGRNVGIALIPYTLEHTNLDHLRLGDPVNVETDVIGRYVVSILKKTYDRAR